MNKILINQTASAINLDIGITIPASGQVTLSPQDFDEAAASDDLVTEIGAGNIVVNDGSVDLGKSDGIRLIQGGFSQKIQLDDDLLMSDRVKVDVSGSLGDGTVFVSGNDGTQGTLVEKIVSANSSISLNELNDGANEDLQIELVPENINTADLNNDANFITSGQAPVQPGDIANFETSTQLDARDTANRDRANHTGTQTASTISDFTSAVQAAETTSTLDLTGNILTYTNEDGQQTVVDLSLYLDDTNLARIVSGVLDPLTGIITFTRDDNTTFTVDASALLAQTAATVPVTPTGNLTATNVQQALEDQQADIDANNLKVSADGSIDTHSDVDVTTNVPTNGQALAWDGSNFVPTTVNFDNGFTIFSIWAEESGGLANNSRQWSFGNGATGNIGIVIPIECELFAVSFNAENGTGTSSIAVESNATAVFTTKEFAKDDFETLGTPVTFTPGERLGFRTATDNGNLGDARVSAWFRIPASAISSGVLNDLLDVSTTGVVSGQAVVYDGSNFVPTTVTVPSDLSTVATTGDYNDLLNLPTLGTAADNAETDFATAAQGALADTAVQPAQIANFETSTQLDDRDTANRNRSNHTGTQLAITISDFTSATQASETTTSISFNNTTKILSYVDEDGATTNIDLTQFLDDTNLARITSGTLDPLTGIATFSRDDASTFTVDFSSLNDQAFINAAIDAHETSITNHDDIDTSGVATGDKLIYNGSTWVPFSDYKVSAKVTTPVGTQLTTFEQALRLNYNIPEAGDYKITVSYVWSLNTTNTNFLSQVQLNDTDILVEHSEEPRDSAGTGATVDILESGGTFNSGTDQRMSFNYSEVLTLPTGTGFIDLDIRNQTSNTEATLYKASLILERFN